MVETMGRGVLSLAIGRALMPGIQDWHGLTLRECLSTKVIVGAVLAGSLVIAAAIATRKTEFESCFDAYVSERVQQGYPLSGAKEGGFRVCGGK